MNVAFVAPAGGSPLTAEVLMLCYAGLPFEWPKITNGTAPAYGVYDTADTLTRRADVF